MSMDEPPETSELCYSARLVVRFALGEHAARVIVPGEGRALAQLHAAASDQR
jgi:hypothetical protein